MKQNSPPEQSVDDIKSPSVRRLLSQRPRLLVRWGSGGLLLLLVTFVGLSWWIPYPEVVKGEVAITDNENRMKIPFHDISTVKEGQEVSITLEGTSGELSGWVESIDPKLIADSKGGPPYYWSEIRLSETSTKMQREAGKQRSGQGSIITEDLTIFERIFGRIRRSVFR